MHARHTITACMSTVHPGHPNMFGSKNVFKVCISLWDSKYHVVMYNDFIMQADTSTMVKIFQNGHLGNWDNSFSTLTYIHVDFIRNSLYKKTLAWPQDVQQVVNTLELCNKINLVCNLMHCRTNCVIHSMIQHYMIILTFTLQPVQYLVLPWWWGMLTDVVVSGWNCGHQMQLQIVINITCCST